ncbi:MAG: site-specific integrase [Syntrophomonadaceae bacterium]
MLAYLESFMDYIKYEKGLAANTSAAYKRDLIKFNEFLISQHRTKEPEDITKQDIRRFLTHQLDDGIS